MPKEGRRNQRVRVPPVETPLRKLRRVRTITQGQMAALLKVSQQTYSKYESGVIRPDVATRERIAKVLGVGVEDLWPRRAPRVRAPEADEARA